MTPTTGVDDESMAVDAAIDVLPTQAKDESYPDTEVAAAADSEPPRATWIQEPTPPTEAGEEWAMPVKKKKGKGKKSKGIPLSAFDEAATKTEQESVQPNLPLEPSFTVDPAEDSISRNLGESLAQVPIVPPNNSAEVARDAIEELEPNFIDTTASAEPEPMVVDSTPVPGRRRRG